MWNNLYSGFINGLGMGSIYALIAIGYTMVYGIARMINFAHGEFITIGAFVSYGTAALIGANPITMVICIIVSMLVCAIVSVITETIAQTNIDTIIHMTIVIGFAPINAAVPYDTNAPIVINSP